ncbi:DUF5082 domain-containing protein [Jeotgalibacillus sp. S-D1]|uniref:YwqH-like family protein n=1 Tax=Jeotgalibacillus sp. S-D1 TaxID=2552189 RepID=UPI0010596D9E|nr:DUF5082 family protein [Jeotgalibacillus sp. S-D1]TDL31328.1 DUF5082 domain-containing protein [Jeotgalibacillus sp. S-D1]
MSLSGELSSLTAGLSSQSANVAQDIERLKTAKQRILTEQEMGLQESRSILEPELGASWRGTRGEAFEEDRSTANEKLKTIFLYEFEGYINLIDSKITALEIRKGFLSGLSSIADEAGDLISRGEDALDAAQDKLSDLRKGISSWL